MSDPFFKNYYRYKVDRLIKEIIKKSIYTIGSILFSYKKKDIDKIRIRKILFIQLFFIGDLLFYTPVIKIIKQVFPNADLDIWAKSKSSLVLNNNPDVNEIIIFDDVKTAEYGDKSKLNIKGKLNFLNQVKNRNYDLIIDFTGLMSSAIFTFLARPKFSIGRNNQGFGFLYNRYLDYNTFENPGHLIVKYINLILDGLFLKGLEKESMMKSIQPKPIIYLDQMVKDTVSHQLNSRNYNLSKPLICIHLSAGWDAKRWSEISFGELIKRLYQTNQYEIAIIGDLKDSKIFMNIVNILEDEIDKDDLWKMFIQLEILESAELIKRSDIFIGSDSAPLHLSGAVNTPSIGLFGPTNPEFSKPFGEDNFVIYHKLDCSASENNQYCTRNAGKNCLTLKCMNLITVDEVLSKIDIMIKRNIKSLNKSSNANN